MNDQPDLFGEAYARNTDPDTSHDAAESIEGDHAARMEKIALEAISASPFGLNNQELVSATGLPWPSITPRVAPLVRKGLVINSGEKRLGPRGKQCIVWKKAP